MNRREFVKTSGLAPMALGVERPTQGHGTSPFLIGRWMIDSGELHFENATTAFVRGMQHRSPQIKFPVGIPRRGDPARVNICWDVCYNRGRSKHRTLAKLVLRVKPLSRLEKDAEIRLVETAQGMLDDERFKPLWPVSLHTTNRDVDQREWWLVKVTGATASLLAFVEKDETI